jgi:hypothetical protein
VDKRRIIYTSQATNIFSKRELLDLLHNSRRHNSINSIYGFLYYKEGFFFQVIEGDTQLIINLWDRIKKDKRHTNVKIILNKSIYNYIFYKWSMGCIEFNNPKFIIIPGVSIDLDSKESVDLLIANLPNISSLLLSNPELNFCQE